MAGSEPNTCPECGTPIRIQLPMGLCARCLVQAAMPGSVLPSQESAVEPAVGALPSGFGDYEILEEIGQGGMGLVYKARQNSLNRVVALKMMLGGHFATAQARARFKVEAESTAHLQHPNIVAIHDVGEHKGLPYLVMDYVTGRGLDTLARAQPLPARSAAAYVAVIARTIAYAHDKGILHRDIKPSNVLIDDSDQVRITDFGLAKRLGGSSQELTLSDQVLGSPNFMPPEQAAGQHQRIGPASDVYGMGATLYFLVTGRPPFVGETISTTTRQVLESDPVAPRLLNPKVPRDLETICLKCLEKDPAKRYATARELAEELDRFVRDEPIQARPPGVFEKGWRWCRRKPVLAAFELVLILGAAGIAWQWRRAVASERVAREHLYVANINLARQSWEENEMGRLRQLLRESRDYPDRGFEWFYLHRLARAEARVVQAHSDPVLGMELTPDHRRLITVGQDGAVGVWDAATGQPLRPFRDGIGPGKVFSIALRPDGAEAASDTSTWTERPPFKIWNPTTGQSIRVIEPGKPHAYSPDGRRIIGQTWREDEPTVTVWDAATGESLLHLRGHAHGDVSRRRGITSAFSQDGKWIATGGEDFTLRIWNATNGTLVHVLRQHCDVITAISFRGSTSHFASAGGTRDRTATLCDAVSGRVIRTFRGHANGIRALRFAPDGGSLVTAGMDGTAVVWDVESGEEVRRLNGHAGQVTGVVFSGDGRRIVTAGSDGTLRWWNAPLPPTRQPSSVVDTPRAATPTNLPIQTLVCRMVAEGWELNVEAGLVRPAEARGTDATWTNRAERLPLRLLDNRTFGSLDTNRGAIGLWDLGTRSVVSVLSVGPRTMSLLAVSPDRRRMLVSSGYDGEVWDVPERRLLFRLPAVTNLVAAAFSPDGRRIVTDADRVRLDVWDAGNGAHLHGLPHGDMFRIPMALTISPDSRFLVSSEMIPRRAQVWDLQTGQPTRVIGPPGGSSDGRTIGISPDGTLLIQDGIDTSTIWEFNSGRFISRLAGLGWAGQYAFSPDGRRVVTRGKAIHVWNVRDGRDLLALRTDGDVIRWAAFSPDGQEIYAIGESRTVRIWKSTPPNRVDGMEE